MKRSRTAVLLVAGLLLCITGVASAASQSLVTLGFLPEVTVDDQILVRGIFTTGALVEISVNGVVKASWKPSGNIYRAQVALEKGLNLITVQGALDGITETRKASVFRTTVNFTDLNGNWAEHDAEILGTLGIVNGVGDGIFGPNLQVSRAQFAKMVVLALALTVDEQATIDFADADKTPNWARPYIAAAVANGLITGYEDNTFRADLLIDRAQIAVIVSRGLRLKAYQPTGEAKTFTDQADIAGWAIADVATATRAGIISGYEDGRFLPSKTATRAEAAAIVRRLWQTQQ